MMSDLFNGLEHAEENGAVFDISCWGIGLEGDGNTTCDISCINSPPVRKLFIGGLPNKISHHDLRVIFSRFGKVRHCHISRSRGGRRRSYGFVTFQHPEDASSALNAPPEVYVECFEMNGRRLVVAPADSWHQPVELPNGKIEWNRRNRLHEFEKKSENSSEKEPESEVLVQPDEEIDESLCRVHILNDDCLMHIFSFLSQRERIKIERVCKRWQAVALGMWLYEQRLEMPVLFPRGKPPMSANKINALLQRCGPNLATLDLSYKPHDLNSKILTAVAKYTPNIRCLNLSGMILNTTAVRTLSKINRQLRQLNLSSCPGLQDRDLNTLFQSCPLLESVILSQNNHLTGKFLVGLKASNLTSLVLNECNNLHSRFLVNGLQDLKNLQNLSLNSCINLSSVDIANILKTVPQLISLSIERYFPLISSNALCSLNLLHNLVTLQLGLNPAVNDRVLEVISQTCLKLKKLDITGCTIPTSEHLISLSNTGLKYLARLPCLENLSASYLADVSDDALDAIADKGLLKVLECRGCPTFTDAGCMRVVALCNKLELFDFSGCDYVSEATVSAAIDAVKMRKNGVKLTMIVGGTRITEEVQNEDIPPLLTLDFRNLCLAHLRPDFVDDMYFPPSDDDDDDDDEDHFLNGLVELAWDPWDDGMPSDDELDEDDFFNEWW